MLQPRPKQVTNLRTRIPAHASDGARVFNAIVKLQIDPPAAGRLRPVSVCLSKGLGAPAGSVLLGPRISSSRRGAGARPYGGMRCRLPPRWDSMRWNIMCGNWRRITPTPNTRADGGIGVARRAATNQHLVRRHPGSEDGALKSHLQQRGILVNHHAAHTPGTHRCAARKYIALRAFRDFPNWALSRLHRLYTGGGNFFLFLRLGA